MATPRRPHPTTRLLAAILIFVGCKGGSSAPRDAPAAVPPRAPADAAAQAAVAPPDAASASPNKIVISIVEPTAPGSGFAKRCAIGGEPLTSDCAGGSAGLAVDKAGVVWITHGTAAHRYRPTAGAPCQLEPAGAPLALPPVPTRSQRLDGPVYMRSGGPDWGLVRLGDALYAHDFLAGLYRIDRGKPEPACTEQFGFKSFAQVGKRVLGTRSGIEQLELRPNGACKVRSAGIDDKARGTIHAIGDKLYGLDFSRVVRREGAKTTPLAADKRLCAVTAMTACGDGACLLDRNCPQLVQLAADDSVLRTIDSGKLFDTRPFSYDDAATGGDGTVYLLARHRDEVAGKAVCETAVYAVPAAVFAR